MSEKKRESRSTPRQLKDPRLKIDPATLQRWRDRKPARRMAEVPADIRLGMSHGLIEAKNLVEWLSVDRVLLAQVVVAEQQLAIDPLAFEKAVAALPKSSPLKISHAISCLLRPHVRIGDEHFQRLASHASDIVREWSSLLIGLDEQLSFKKKLAWMKPLADDENPGVREMAWISMRHHLVTDLDGAIECLIPWTGSRNERLRRYASEITRPRGVWTTHLQPLKEEPQRGLPILEPLRADESKYVQNSVANWLNDASKSSPRWVTEVTQRWARESPNPATKKIIHRATRTIRSQSPTT